VPEHLQGLGKAAGTKQAAAISNRRDDGAGGLQSLRWEQDAG